jgi:hypothetical protein
MRRLLLLPLLLLNDCGTDEPGLAISLPPGQVTLEASSSVLRIRHSTFVGGDAEATMFWSGIEEDGSLRVFGQSVGFDLEVGVNQPVSDDDRSAWLPSACRHEEGLAVAWTDMPVELPNGITLNESDVAATMSWPPAGALRIVNPNSVGRQGSASIACLAGGGRVVAWKNNCFAVERDGDTTYVFEPEECDGEPAHGSYLRFLDAAGEPTSAAIQFGDQISPSPLLASAGGDRFVALTGSRLQSWVGPRLMDEIEEVDAWSDAAELTCVESRCVTVVGGHALLFDATHLSSSSVLVFQESIHPSPNELIYPRGTRLACDPSATCVVTWALDHETWEEDTVETVTIGVYAAAFDMERGTLGQTVLVREPAYNENGALVAATGRGEFLLASDLDNDFVVQRLLVD